MHDLRTLDCPPYAGAVNHHGLPETRFSWHHRIAALCHDRFVIAVDPEGYTFGRQSARTNLDWWFAQRARDDVPPVARQGRRNEFNRAWCSNRSVVDSPTRLRAALAELEEA